MTNKKTNEHEDYNEHEDKDFSELRSLAVTAPENALGRLRKRLGLALLGKDLIERQAMSFWVVLDAFLRLFFAGKQTVPARKPGQSNAAND